MTLMACQPHVIVKRWLLSKPQPNQEPHSGHCYRSVSGLCSGAQAVYCMRAVQDLPIVILAIQLPPHLPMPSNAFIPNLCRCLFVSFLGSVPAHFYHPSTFFTYWQTFQPRYLDISLAPSNAVSQQPSITKYSQVLCPLSDAYHVPIRPANPLIQHVSTLTFSHIAGLFCRQTLGRPGQKNWTFGQPNFSYAFADPASHQPWSLASSLKHYQQLTTQKFSKKMCENLDCHPYPMVARDPRH